MPKNRDRSYLSDSIYVLTVAHQRRPDCSFSGGVWLSRGENFKMMDYVNRHLQNIVLSLLFMKLYIYILAISFTWDLPIIKLYLYTNYLLKCLWIVQVHKIWQITKCGQQKQVEERLSENLLRTGGRRSQAPDVWAGLGRLTSARPRGGGRSQFPVL